MFLSIIIPMYNSEKFIGDCIESLLSQKFDPHTTEVIIINDGSTDQSKNIVEKYIKTSPIFKLVNQTNEGNGSARNKGVSLAKGRYIYFLDSDDYLVHGILNDLLSILEKHDLDILGFKSKLVEDSSYTKSDNFEKLIDTIPINRVNGLDFLAKNNYRAEVWWFIFKKELLLLGDIKFYNKKFVQDSYITPSIFINAKKVFLLPLDIHRYRQNEQSITNKKTPSHVTKHMLDLAFATKKIETLKSQINHKGAIDRLNNRQQGYAFFFLLRFSKSDMTLKNLNQHLNEFKAIKAFPFTNLLGKDYNSNSFKIMVFLFNHSLLRKLTLVGMQSFFRYKSLIAK